LKPDSCPAIAAPEHVLDCVALFFIAASLQSGFAECDAQPAGKLQGIVVGPEMKEEKSGLFVQHVTVDRSDVDPIRPQCFDHRIDLVTRKNEIPGDGRLAAPGRLEIDAAGKAQRPDGLNGISPR
jgi:hypothetical protein